MKQPEVNLGRNFEGKITREELVTILSRAVSYSNGMATAYFEDDLRMLGRIAPLFIGRAAFPWEPTPWAKPEDAGRSGDDYENLQFERGLEFTRRIHELLPQSFIQAVVWEGVFPAVNEISIPEWVFTGLDRTPEKRTFRYEDMFGPDYESMYRWDDHGEGCQVYDITYPESQLWVYYRSCQYINAGFEAIHMGQPHKYAAKDHRYTILADLYDRIRKHAIAHSRRSIVLLDSHTHGIARDGKLLYDLHARPISARAWKENPEKVILHLKGGNLGGITPSGWSCKQLPFLVEIDNWGGYSLDPEYWDDVDLRAASGRWGYDDSAWFARQSSEDRHHFLRYGHRWTMAQTDVSWFQMPLRRRLDRAKITTPQEITHYHANNKSEHAPLGFSDEDVIEEIWKESTPRWLEQWHGVLAGATPVEQRDIASPIVIVGELQRFLGGIPGESYGAFSRLTHVEDDLFELVFVIPWKGSYEFSLSIGGTMTDVTRSGGHAGGDPYRLATNEDNQWVRLMYRHWDRKLTAEDAEGESLLA